MRLFGRRRRFPRDMVERLELFGRYEMDPWSSGLDGGDLAQQCIIPFLEDAQGDPESFTSELRDLVAGDRGGYATYGASRLVFELLSEYRTAGALALLDAAIVFKRTMGLPIAHLNGFEMERWRQTSRGEPW
jgi:hypothetical protein